MKNTGSFEKFRRVRLRPARAPVTVAIAAAIASSGSKWLSCDVHIPDGGRDETGELLASMQVMQGAIRSMIAREEARAISAEARMIGALAQANATARFTHTN